jgi:hypothetical protein
MAAKSKTGGSSQNTEFFTIEGNKITLAVFPSVSEIA